MQTGLQNKSFPKLLLLLASDCKRGTEFDFYSRKRIIILISSLVSLVRIRDTKRRVECHHSKGVNWAKNGARSVLTLRLPTQLQRNPQSWRPIRNIPTETAIYMSMIFKLYISPRLFRIR